MFGKFCAQKSFVRSVLEQAPNEIGHSGKQLAYRAIFADAISHLNERPLDWSGHSIEELKLEPAAVDSELVREGLRVRDSAHIVRSERGGDNRFVFEEQSGEGLEICIALGLLRIDRTIPAVLARFYRFVIPVGAFDQSHRETRAARSTPFDQIAQISFRVP